MKKWLCAALGFFICSDALKQAWRIRPNKKAQPQSG
jgi:hypothetical protein